MLFYFKLYTTYVHFTCLNHKYQNQNYNSKPCHLNLNPCEEQCFLEPHFGIDLAFCRNATAKNSILQQDQKESEDYNNEKSKKLVPLVEERLFHDNMIHLFS